MTFIDADEIAAAAVEALAGNVASFSELVLTGTRAFGYEEVAELITAASGHRVRHHRLSAVDLASRLERVGLPPDYASLLAAMEAFNALGAEDRVTATVECFTHQTPNTFEEFLAKQEIEVRLTDRGHAQRRTSLRSLQVRDHAAEGLLWAV